MRKFTMLLLLLMVATVIVAPAGANTVDRLGDCPRGGGWLVSEGQDWAAHYVDTGLLAASDHNGDGYICGKLLAHRDKLLLLDNRVPLGRGSSDPGPPSD